MIQGNIFYNFLRFVCFLKHFQLSLKNTINLSINTSNSSTLISVIIALISILYLTYEELTLWPDRRG